MSGTLTDSVWEVIQNAVHDLMSVASFGGGSQTLLDLVKITTMLGDHCAPF